MKDNGDGEKLGVEGDVMVREFVKTPNLQPSAFPAATPKLLVFWLSQLAANKLPCHKS